MKWKTRLLPIFSFDRIVRRAVASWFFMALVVLLVRNGDFSSTAFLKDLSWDLPICVFLGFFLLISALAAVLPTKRTDGFAMLLGLVVVSSAWLSRLAMTAEEKWLFCFVLVGVFALVLWDFVSQNEDILSAIHLPNRVSPWAAVLCGVICCVVIAVTTCLRYINFATPTYDFGIFIQMFHNMAESFEPITTCERDKVLSHFAVHLSPIYYVLLPFYWLFPSPLTLQIGQAVIVASGIIPFYLLMKKYGFSAKARVAFSVLYMLIPAISKGCFFDLHENCFLFPLLLWIFWAYESEKIPLLALFTALCCLVKEDSAVYVTIFALYCLISGTTKKRKLMGAGMALYAVLYFLFAVWYIDTFGEGIMSGRYDNVSSDGSLVGVIFTAFANPGFFFQEILTRGWESVKYILALLVPLGFLPMATGKLSRWLLLIPMLLNLLTEYPYQLELLYQYHFGISAFLLLLAIMNLRDLRGKLRVYMILVPLAASFVFYSYLIIPEMGGRIKTYQANRESFAVLEATLDTIPEDASVNASTFILPHLAQRWGAYDVGYHPEADTDLVILDIRSGYDETSKKMAKACGLAGYRHLLETKQIAIFVSPDWTGDVAALKEAVKEVAPIVYESITQEERLASMAEIVSVIPEDASVVASESLLVHLSPREEIYGIASHARADVDFVVFDIRFGHSDQSIALLFECVNNEYDCLIADSDIMIYVSPLWRGDFTALEDALTEMGYLNEIEAS